MFIIIYDYMYILEIINDYHHVCFPGSKENVKNKSSSSKKGKDKKEEPKGKITFVGKRLVVDMEKRSRKRLVDEDDEDVVVDEAGPSKRVKGRRRRSQRKKL